MAFELTAKMQPPNYEGRMIGSIARIRALTWPERRLLLTAILLLPSFALALRFLGLMRFRAWLDLRPGAVLAPRREPIASVATLVGAAANHGPFPSTCLTRSLLLDWLLRRRGVKSEMRIGVRVAKGTLEAHAWVEVDGRPVNDAPDIAQRYAPISGALPAQTLSSP